MNFSVRPLEFELPFPYLVDWELPNSLDFL